jgi:hypothetical protein
LFKVWRGPGDRNISDEEWEEQFWRLPDPHHGEVDVEVDTREMLNDVFQSTDDPVDLEERVWDEVMVAFTAADRAHEESSQGGGSSDDDDSAPMGMEEPTRDTNTVEGQFEDSFDPQPLEDALEYLYSEARYTKLAATILLMNLCTVHGISNSFTNEFFAILHGHLLLERNSLPKNYHAVKSFIRKLGLSYNSIHACKKGCVLVRGDHVEAMSCPKCQQLRYKDPARIMFPVKVLKHFPIILRLQRMFQSPAISKFML